MRLLVVQSVLLLAVITFVSTDDTKDSSEVNSLITKRNANEGNESADILTYLRILRGKDGRDVVGLKGQKGERGETGKKGEKGDKGAVGPTGNEGERGKRGERGERGEEGEKGDTGPVGPAGAKSGGVVYTRWGRKTCPNTGAQLLYEGIAGGSGWRYSGGAANYVCLPEVPQYLSTITITNGMDSSLNGVQYENVNDIFPEKNNHNVPCAVCYTSTKAVKLMIPARTSCPSSWTVEYKGYLMTERWNHARNAVYECVDENPESISGSHADTGGALLYFTLSLCDTGIPCPPYVFQRPITCVVCTK